MFDAKFPLSNVHRFVSVERERWLWIVEEEDDDKSTSDDLSFFFLLLLAVVEEMQPWRLPRTRKQTTEMLPSASH